MSEQGSGGSRYDCLLWSLHGVHLRQTERYLARPGKECGNANREKIQKMNQRHTNKASRAMPGDGEIGRGDVQHEGVGFARRAARVGRLERAYIYTTRVAPIPCDNQYLNCQLRQTNIECAPLAVREVTWTLKDCLCLFSTEMWNSGAMRFRYSACRHSVSVIFPVASWPPFFP